MLMGTANARGGKPGMLIAVQDDIPALSRHHRLMFEEIQTTTGVPANPSDMAGLEKGYAEKLAREFASGSCISWVVKIGPRIVSSGGLSIVSYVPVPHDLSVRIAFLHSIYTEEKFRNKGYAGQIVGEAARYCREKGIRRTYLFASGDGRPVYEKAGFVPVPDTMLLLQ
jgi:GNAT superfamily N-acetyltransferase